ncbi:Putative protein in type-1 retrotransposable element R1DM [Araneus ventricosus]|uniref:Reverse transcriptase domain-containing protein n=1 Tax=Araneus ventricosus TaxID=182803 RepID=A0A4Y2MYX3_ARAVE|nr:Putative protein in type-1 retrotransposable element R1DM [Araneus ventricosus]
MRHTCQQQYKAIFRAGRPSSDLFQQSTPAGTELSFAQNILETLDPDIPQAPFIDRTASSQPNDNPFSSRKLRKIIKELNKTKAPGYDGLDKIILQQIHSASPELLMEMFNKYPSLGFFPTSFKTGVIVLFSKEGNDQNDPKFYRQVSLLPSMGKLLEKVMIQHLTYFLKTTRQLGPKQFAFKEGVSIGHALDSLLTTIDSHKRNKMHGAVVSIDIKGAFNNLKYSSIVEKLSNSQCPPKIQSLFRNRLQDRNVIIPTNEEVTQQPQTRGCPQVSCSGPALWNLVAEEAFEQ